MGAEEFEATVSGDSVKDAFWAAVQQAQYDYGHSGYTGTIAEKGEYVVFKAPAGTDDAMIMQVIEAVSRFGWSGRQNSPEDEAARIAYAAFPLDEMAAVFDDKWGPAGAIQLADGSWHFFGMASS